MTGGVFTPQGTQDIEAFIALSVRQTWRGRPSERAIGLTVAAVHVPPPSWSSKRRTAALEQRVPCLVLPDLDNVIKLVADALNGLIYKDDRQIVRVTGAREWGERPAIVITICEL
jgi:Holliday junction resolvase RusA-like endonuclease